MAKNSGQLLLGLKTILVDNGMFRRFNKLYVLATLAFLLRIVDVYIVRDSLYKHECQRRALMRVFRIPFKTILLIYKHKGFVNGLI